MNKMLSSQEKTKIYNILAEAYLDLIRKGLIGRFERRVLSRRILDNVEKANSYSEVSFFIKRLLTVYPVFQSASVRIDAEVENLHEKQVVNRLAQFIHTA